MPFVIVGTSLITTNICEHALHQAFLVTTTTVVCLPSISTLPASQCSNEYTFYKTAHVMQVKLSWLPTYKIKSKLQPTKPAYEPDSRSCKEL